MRSPKLQLSPTLQLFLAFLAGVIILLTSLSALVHQAEWRQQLRSVETLERASVELMQQVIAGVFDDLVGDLLFLTEQNELQALLKGQEDTRAAVAAEYLALATHKGVYDQIRFLDAAGMEQVRVNYNAGAPSVVADADLQDKHRRYYFTDVIRLQPGEVFVSPFDLNIEQGAIERPLKPMIRIGTPVLDDQGRKAGILLLNYLGAHLLQRLREAAATGRGDPMLLNAEGDWLLAPDPDDTWGFMLPGREPRAFARRFPAIWSQMQQEARGQTLTPDGLFTFLTSYPLDPGLYSSTGASSAHAPSREQLGAERYAWFLVSHVSDVELDALRADVLQRGLLIGSGSFLLLAIGAWLLASAIARRRTAQKRLETLAHYDALTGLPNRVLFFDRLEHTHRNAQRYARRYGLLYLDLDGFKAVNDNHGHRAGDTVLATIAQRLKQRLRDSDTAARLGGDELAVLLSECPGLDATVAMGNELIALVEEPIPVDDGEVRIGVSIGAAVYPDHGDDPTSVLRCADQAMYRAKRQRRGVCLASEAGCDQRSS